MAHVGLRSYSLTSIPIQSKATHASLLISFLVQPAPIRSPPCSHTDQSHASKRPRLPLLLNFSISLHMDIVSQFDISFHPRQRLTHTTLSTSDIFPKFGIAGLDGTLKIQSYLS